MKLLLRATFQSSNFNYDPILKFFKGTGKFHLRDNMFGGWVSIYFKSGRTYLCLRYNAKIKKLEVPRVQE